LPQLALRSQIHSADDRVSALEGGRCHRAAELLDFSGRNDLGSSLVRHRTCCHRSCRSGQTCRAPGGAVMTFLSFVFILTSLVTFVAGQLFLKRAMESTTKSSGNHQRFGSLLRAGIFLMTISFFLTLGLL